MTGMWESSKKIMLLFILGSDLFHMAVGQKSFPIQMHLDISQDTGYSLQLVEMGRCLHHILTWSNWNLCCWIEHREWYILSDLLDAIRTFKQIYLEWEQPYRATGLAVRPCPGELSLCPSSTPTSIIWRRKLFSFSLKPRLSSWKAYVGGDQATALIVRKPVVKIRPWWWLCTAAAPCCTLGCVWHCCPWRGRSVGKQIYQHLQAGKSLLLVCESQKGMQYTVVLNCLCSLYYNKL